MTLTLHLALLIVAVVLFAIAALNYNPPRLNLIAGGLAFVTLALIF